MNKSFFYSAVVALTVGMAVAPSAVMAQTMASAQQPAVTISDLQSALSAQTPDLAQIQAIVGNLMAQDPNNITAIQALAQNASPEVQAAINLALGATGTIGGQAGAPAGGNNGGGANGGSGGGASGTADDVEARLRALEASPN